MGEYCHADANCTNLDGSHHCYCLPGYSGDGTECEDINECSNSTLNNCHTNASCNNTKGSYNCSCNLGYAGDGVNCSGMILDTHLASKHKYKS